MLSDYVIDVALELAELIQRERGVALCPDCLTARLARRLIQIAPILERPEVSRAHDESLLNAVRIAINDVLTGKCPQP